MVKRIQILIVLSLLLLISACGNKEAEDPIEEEDLVNDEKEEMIEEEFPFNAPLSGIGLEEEIEHRVVGVTINNHPAARPQSGIVDADLVYEVLAEGEMTRFIAIFHSVYPERVGPIRSARPYLIDLVKGYDGMYVAHGWSPEAERMLKNGYADHLNGLFYDGTLFERSSDRKAPHNSYITFEHLLEGMEEKGYELNGAVGSLTFADELDIEDEEVESFEINYYNRNDIQYIYDEEKQLYHRFNGESQTVDYETDRPIEIANVFVVETDHRILDDVGRREINLKSGGRALLFQNGKVQQVEWKNENGIIIPIHNGERLPLKPGQTWINIVPTSPGMDEIVTYEQQFEEENDDNAN